MWRKLAQVSHIAAIHISLYNSLEGKQSGNRFPQESELQDVQSLKWMNSKHSVNNVVQRVVSSVKQVRCSNKSDRQILKAISDGTFTAKLVDDPTPIVCVERALDFQDHDSHDHYDVVVTTGLLSSYISEDEMGVLVATAISRHLSETTELREFHFVWSFAKLLSVMGGNYGLLQIIAWGIVSMLEKVHLAGVSKSKVLDWDVLGLQFAIAGSFDVKKGINIFEKLDEYNPPKSLFDQLEILLERDVRNYERHRLLKAYLKDKNIQISDLDIKGKEMI